MPQDRQKSPGSFKDELGDLIERVASPKEKRPETGKQPKSDSAEDRMFWRRPDED